ncbi:Sec-independent protein translocase subunit TatA, partial [Nocardia alni]|uniref:Sec-independent protein translocase subunit TatA n=1 Tax=Nocardia alni TaxID=2815723 RepID=UPI001C249619
MGTFGPTHWIIIVLLVLVLFGAKRLPDAARGLGRSLRIFKSEMSEMQSEGSPATHTNS